VLGERREGGAPQSRRGAARPDRLGQKRDGQRRDGIASRPQGHDGEHDPVDAEVEIAAEASPRGILGEVAVRGGDESDVEAHGLDAPTRYTVRVSSARRSLA